MLPLFLYSSSLAPEIAWKSRENGSHKSSLRERRTKKINTDQEKQT